MGTVNQGTMKMNEFVARNGIIALNNVQITGSLSVTNGITGSLSGSATSALSSSYASTSSYANSFTVGGTLVAQTLVVQTITSSVEYSSGSNSFGSSLANTQTFTGSVGITGSLSVNGNESITGSLGINGPTGSTLFSSNVDALILTGSLLISGSSYFTGSLNILGSLNATSSQAITASYALTASYVSGSSSVSASYALTASYAVFALSASSAPGYTVNFVQATPATTWSFLHNLNTRNPIVQVYDTGYNQILPNAVIGIDANNAQIRFDYAQSGYAVLSSGGGLLVTGSTALLNQTSANTTWSFTHNLNSKYVNFTVYDTSDNVMVPLGIKAITNNYAEIYFSSLKTGIAVAQFSGINGAPNATTASYAYSASFLLGTNSSSYVGNYAGSASNAATYSIFIGEQAGANAASSSNATIIGSFAGLNASSSLQLTALGYSAGISMSNSSNTTAVGPGAGYGASNAIGSAFFGTYAGANAISSSNSTFIGPFAGWKVSGSSYSTFVGYNAGASSLLGNNNILIGTNTTLASGSTNAINIGGLIFGSGSYFSTSSVSSGSANGYVGINQPNPQYSLDVSGSVRASGNIYAQTLVVQTVTASVEYSSGSNVFGNSSSNTHQFTGSLLLTGSQTILQSAVGIGTGSLGSYKLVVSQNNALAQIAQFDTFGPNGGWTAYSNTGSIYGYIGNSYNLSTPAGATNDFAIYSVNNLALNTGTATTKLFISASGNVGIGTSSPNTTLDVNGTINVRTNGYQFGRITTNNIDAVNGGLTFQFINSNSFQNGIILNYAGNVGIGTTSPSSKLEVYSGSGANYIYATNGTAATFNGLMIRYNSTDYMGAIGNPSSGEFRIGGFNVSGYFTTIYSNNSETVRVTGGNVGIGTTSPGNLLEVQGTAKLNAPTSGTVNLAFGISGTNYASIKYNDADGSLTTQTLGGYPLILGTNITERMRITSGGNVGIGTSAPSYSLDVNGTGRFVGNLYANAKVYASSVIGSNLVAGNIASNMPSSPAYILIVDLNNIAGFSLSGKVNAASYTCWNISDIWIQKNYSSTTASAGITGLYKSGCDFSIVNISYASGNYIALKFTSNPEIDVLWSGYRLTDQVSSGAFQVITSGVTVNSTYASY